MVMKLDTYNNSTDNYPEKQGVKAKGVTYWLHIPQAGLLRYGYADLLDLTDCCILSHIYYFHLNPTKNKDVKYIHFKRMKYVWINYTYLITANRLLPINSKSAVSKRIKKLEKLGLINIYKAPENSIYVKPTQHLADIYNYYVENDRKYSDRQNTYISHDPINVPNRDGANSMHVSPETIGCFPQSAQHNK